MKFYAWGSALAAAAIAAVAFSCNVAKKSGSQLDSIQSIHHGGKIILWFSPDAKTYHAKLCDKAVNATKIESVAEMNQACPGEAPAKDSARAELRGMMTKIAEEDSGFDQILRDQAKIDLLAELRREISGGQWEVDEVATEVEALRGQLLDLEATLKQQEAELARMRDTATAAATAAGRVATDQDLDLIFGEAYREVLKALQRIAQNQNDTKTGIQAQLKAFDEAKAVVVASRAKLEKLVDEVLDKIADKDRLYTVSLLQKENFEFALLQSAAIRLGLVESHAPRKVTCEQVCSDESPFQDRTRCYSCRCKMAMGGSLPGPDEINCKVASEIKVYKAKTAPAGAEDPFVLTEQKEDPGECFNPSLLYGDCQIGSKLGQLVKNDIYYKWICRHRSSSDMKDEDATYDDVGVIAINTATGASCWWDDGGGIISDKVFPKLDLTDATQAEIDLNKEVFYNTTGEGCTNCHDNDPFMFSPYFRSVQWKSGDYVRSDFQTVQLDGSLRRVAHSYLDAEGAEACTSCHRIASGSTCFSWANQSMGMTKRDGHEQIVLDAIDQGEGAVSQPGRNWQLAYWMPPMKTFFKGTHDKWLERFGEAKTTLQRCCSDEGATGCSWVDATGAPVQTANAFDAMPDAPVAQ